MTDYPNIPARPTTYAGIEFRSRLEARWAFFFDFFKLQWEYEPKAFYWPDGMGYLPDFHVEIPILVYTAQHQYKEIQWNGHVGDYVWIEVKPLARELTNKEQQKAYRFAMEHSLVLLRGDPMRHRAVFMVSHGGLRHLTVVHFVWTGEAVGLLASFTKDSSGKHYSNLPAGLRRSKSAARFLSQAMWKGPLRGARLKARQVKFNG